MTEQMKGLIRDGVTRTVRLDHKTGFLVLIDAVHHLIHKGNAYCLSQLKAVDAFDIASPMTYHIVVGTTPIHLTMLADATSAATLELFEDNGNALHFDISGGSAVTPVNRNRNSANVSLATIKTGVTVTKATTDVLKYTRMINYTSGELEGSFQRLEWILAPSTEYLVKFTSIADNNEGSLAIEFYEHIDID